MTSTGSRTCAAVILAAGEGTRMKSRHPKVMHRVAGRSMLAHVIATASEAGADRLAIIIGPDHDDVGAEATRQAPEARICIQRDRLGTAHAVLAAREVLGRDDDLVVLYGDVPLVQPDTVLSMRRKLADGAAVVVLGFEAADPKGYGRLLVESGKLSCIREEKDASSDEKLIRLCNGGLMAIDGKKALSLLESVKNFNAQKEFYLTDIVELARSRGWSAEVHVVEENEILGVNDRLQLAAAERVMQWRLRERAMRNGVTMVAPETIFLSFDTVLGRDVVVEPHVVFGPGVDVAEGAVIHSFSHIEGARVEPRASIGPYARLRPGSVIGEAARIGNFVETKNAVFGAGAKANHLSYLGDASIGAGANIGAGTITCNYDGFNKYRTEIGEAAFVGSNSSLIAPILVGAGAYIGSGSVVTEDVPDDALAVARGRQVIKSGWAKGFRARHSEEEAVKR